MNFESKPIPTKFKMLISVSTLFLVLIGFNQCVMKTTINNKASTSKYGTTDVPAPADGNVPDINQDKTLPPGVDMPPMNSGNTNSDLALMDVGVKNFEQINLTMSNLTGIPTNNTNVQTVYNDIVIQLPTDNNIKSFLPSMQVAITKLATEYCDRLIETGAYKATIWPAINFTQTPTQTFTPTNKTLLINQTISYFFGPIDTASVDSSKVELLSLYDSLITGESLTSSATTKKVVKGICTAALSSAYVTLF
jgi:hypothetical protein